MATLLLWLWLACRTAALVYSRAIFEDAPELKFETPSKPSGPLVTTLTQYAEPRLLRVVSGNDRGQSKEDQKGLNLCLSILSY